MALADSESVTREISSSVMSPYCPGRLLSDCPSGQAHELKTKIKGMLDNGKTRKDVETFLLASYGEQILAAPRFSNFGVWAWLTPFIFLFTGFFAWMLWMKTKSKNNSLSINSAQQQLNKEMLDRINKELE